MKYGVIMLFLSLSSLFPAVSHFQEEKKAREGQSNEIEFPRIWFVTLYFAENNHKSEHQLYKTSLFFCFEKLIIFNTDDGDI